VGLLCLLAVISRRYTPHVHCHGSFFCVRLCLLSLLYVMSYTLFRALYDEFLAGCCYVDHTFAVFPNAFACLLYRRFPHAFRHLFPYACLSYINFTSLLFLVRFSIRCSKHFSRQNPMRIPRLPSDAFIRFLCIHPGHPTCFSIHYTVCSL